MPAPDSEVEAVAQALDDLLTMLGVDPSERSAEGGPSVGEVLASAAVAAIDAKRATVYTTHTRTHTEPGPDYCPACSAYHQR